MRVYIPSTLPGVARLLREGVVTPHPTHGYAVTPALREWYASGDIEELEYVAMTHAARACLHLLAADPKAPRRRVVLAAEIADGQVSAAHLGAGGPDGGRRDDPARVQISTAVRLGDVVSGHVDDPAAAEEVGAAVEALAEADAGDEDARFVVDGAEGNELAWYATQELADLAVWE